MDMVYQYNPVMAADEQLGLVVTRAACDALFDSNGFVIHAAGLSPIDKKQREVFIAELADSYGDFTDKQKKMLSDAEVNWAQLIFMWQNWDSSRRAERMRMAGVGSAKSPDDVPRVARNLENWAGIDASVLTVRQLNGLQGDISTLEYTRSILSSYGPHE